MGRTRSSVSSFPRRRRYNLRSRSRTKYDFFDSLSANDGVLNSEENKKKLPKVTSLDLCKEENAPAHHTDLYETSYLVLRRGQAFTFRVKFDQVLSSDDKVSIILTTGECPYPSKGTLLSFHLRNCIEKFGWKMESSTADDEEYKLRFTSSPDAIIGKYVISVQISSESAIKTTKMKEIFCLVFNPWNPEDVTYMEESAERDEYVMNETGRIFIGSRSYKYGRPWIYGQFEECSLEVALYILQISELTDNALSNPVIVSRTFSKMANSFDDNGIIVGNWTDDYSEGTEPTDWVSSVDILQEYWDTKTDVKYGQCWVFAGLLTTLFRAIGIPVRCITTYESAHDTDGSMTVDRHWNYDDTPLTDLNDSVWNFHVWNEVWFRRADLPDGHDGWQVVDGTPQEASEGVMQCGPASLRSVKEGDAYLPYDTKFIIAEVNGDIIEWVKEKTGEMTPVWRDRDSIGYYISTKAVGSSRRVDVTHNYKYEEGSAKENHVVTRIANFSSRKAELLKFYSTESSKSVEFKLEGTAGVSGDVDITLDIKNLAAEAVDIDVTFTCVASYYNGLTSDKLKVVTQHIQVNSSGETSVQVNLAAEDYLNRIATDAVLTVFCRAKVRQTGQQYYKKEAYPVDRPDIQLQLPSSESVNKSFSINVSYTNQLKIALTECRLRVNGPGLQAVHPVKLLKSTIAPGETINQTVTFKARSAGVKEVISFLHTRQLQNVTGSATMTVR